MFVTQHAQDRIFERMHTPGAALDIIEALEASPGYRYTVVIVLARGLAIVSPDGSNGDTLIAIAVDGSVDTIYARRSEQTLDPRHFGADRVIDLYDRGIPEPTCRGMGDIPGYIPEQGYDHPEDIEHETGGEA
jgi:hypothetical protein